jgi:hypothetical protein
MKTQSSPYSIAYKVITKAIKNNNVKLTMKQYRQIVESTPGLPWDITPDSLLETLVLWNELEVKNNHVYLVTKQPKVENKIPCKQCKGKEQKKMAKKSASLTPVLIKVYQLTDNQGRKICDDKNSNKKCMFCSIENYDEFSCEDEFSCTAEYRCFILNKQIEGTIDNPTTGTYIHQPLPNCPVWASTAIPVKE